MYAKVVEPRARALKEAWQDAATTSGFRNRLKEHDLGMVINYQSESRIKQIAEMAVVLELHGVETRTSESHSTIRKTNPS